MADILTEKISAELKDTNEQKAVVGPLVAYLCSIGWSLDQIRFGKREWYVPKTPSEASKRERGQSFDGFPCDIVVFDSPRNKDDYRKIALMIECKQPDENAGLNQLEIYLSNEPHAKFGAWINHSHRGSRSIFVYKQSEGLLPKRSSVGELPRPGDKISPDLVKTTFSDLVEPNADILRVRFNDLLDRVVARDSNVTRREDQLDQLCNLVLLKLESDKRAQASSSEEVVFRTKETAQRTLEHIEVQFENLVKLYPEVFTEKRDQELRLAPETVHECVEDLFKFKLLDASAEVVSIAFQVLRSAALKQGEGQYFTPQPVIEAAVRLMQISWDDIIIDPACGTGGFLIEALRYMGRQYPDRNLEVSRWAQRHLFGIDKDAVGVKLTKAVMQILGDGSAHCARGDSISKHKWSDSYPHLQGTSYSDGRFSLVLTNPPFGTNLKIPAEEARRADLQIANVEGHWRELEIGLLFLNRSWQLLRKGGRVCIVLPETYFFSTNYAFVTRWLNGKFEPLAVVNVPMEAFQGFCRAKTNLYVFEKL